MKRNFAVIAAVCFAFTLVLLPRLRSDAPKTDVVASITQLENDAAKANLANDVSFIKKNVADDYIEGTSFGEWITKAQNVKDADDPTNNKTNSYEMSDLQVTSYGNAGIARYRVTYDDLYHGQHRSRSIICSDTWLQQGSAWKEVSGHCSQTK